MCSIIVDSYNNNNNMDIKSSTAVDQIERKRLKLKKVTEWNDKRIHESITKGKSKFVVANWQCTFGYGKSLSFTTRTNNLHYLLKSVCCHSTHVVLGASNWLDEWFLSKFDITFLPIWNCAIAYSLVSLNLSTNTN